MGWFGPQSGGCSCCDSGTCCNNAFDNVVARWSTLSVSASGAALSSPLSASIGIVNDSPARCNVAASAKETGSTRASVMYLIDGPASCPEGYDINEMGIWMNAQVGSGSPDWYSCGISAEIFVFCDGSGNLTYRLSASLVYPLRGSNDCNDFTGSCIYQLPHPVSLGYTADGYNGSTPIHWSKANGTNQNSNILGESYPYSDPQRLAFCPGYEYYSTADNYFLETSNLDDFPTSITLDPLYNPGGITGSVGLS